MSNPDSSSTWRGLVGALLAGSGVHWLITPIDHPLASAWRYGAVWLQVIAGLALLWSARPRRRARASA